MTITITITIGARLVAREPGFWLASPEYTLPPLVLSLLRCAAGAGGRYCRPCGGRRSHFLALPFAPPIVHFRTHRFGPGGNAHADTTPGTTYNTRAYHPVAFLSSLRAHAKIHLRHCYPTLLPAHTNFPNIASPGGRCRARGYNSAVARRMALSLALPRCAPSFERLTLRMHCASDNSFLSPVRWRRSATHLRSLLASIRMLACLLS